MNLLSTLNEITDTCSDNGIGRYVHELTESCPNFEQFLESVEYLEAQSEQDQNWCGANLKRVEKDSKMVQSFELQKVDFLSKTILKLFETFGALIRLQPVDSQKYLQKTVAVAFNSLIRAPTMPRNTAARPGMPPTKLPVVSNASSRGAAGQKPMKEQNAPNTKLHSSSTSIGITTVDEHADVEGLCSLSPSTSISSITSISSNQSSKEEKNEETQSEVSQKQESDSYSSSSNDDEKEADSVTGVANKDAATNTTENDSDDNAATDDDSSDSDDNDNATAKKIAEKKPRKKTADINKESQPSFYSPGHQKSHTQFAKPSIARYSKSFSTLNLEGLDNGAKDSFKKMSCDFSGANLRKASPQYRLQSLEEQQTSPLESDKYMYSIIQSFKNASKSSGQQGFSPKVSRNSFVLSQSNDVFYNTPNFYFFYLQLLENEVKGITKQHLKLHKEEDIDLTDPIEVHYLRSFLKSNFTDENLDFSCDVLHFKTLATEEERKVYARYIYEMYISSNSPSQVNVNGKIRLNIQNTLINNAPIRDTLFDLAFQEIFNNICSNRLIEQFKSSEMYKRCAAHQKGMSDFAYPWQENPLPKRQEPKNVDAKKKKFKLTQRQSGYPPSVTSDSSANTREYEPPLAKLLSTPELLADFKSFLVKFKEPLSYLQGYTSTTAKAQPGLRQSGSILKSSAESDSTKTDELLVNLFTTSIYRQYIKTGTWKNFLTPEGNSKQEQEQEQQQQEQQQQPEDEQKKAPSQLQQQQWINDEHLLRVGRGRAATFCDSSRDWWNVGPLGRSTDAQEPITLVVDNKPKGPGKLPELKVTPGKQKRGFLGLFKKTPNEKDTDNVKGKEKKKSSTKNGKNDNGSGKKGASFDEQDYISTIISHYDISDPTLATPTNTLSTGIPDHKQEIAEASVIDTQKSEGTKMRNSVKSSVEQSEETTQESTETEPEEQSRETEKTSFKPFIKCSSKIEANEESEESTTSTSSHGTNAKIPSKSTRPETQAPLPPQHQKSPDLNDASTLPISFSASTSATFERSECDQSSEADTSSKRESNPVFPFSFLPTKEGTESQNKNITISSFTLETDEEEEEHQDAPTFSFATDLKPTLVIPEPTTPEEAFRSSFTQKFNELAQILQSNLSSDGKRYKSAQQKVHKIKSILDSYDPVKGKKVKQKHAKSDDKSLNIQEIQKQLSAFFDAMVANPEKKEIISLTKALNKVVKD